ncbi:MAG TPA: hypothetical protein VGN41_17460 [Streptosporangiaceae bacterium]
MSDLSPEAGPHGDVRARLGRALRDALKARDQVAASALRSALAAIANAEAVPPAASPPSGPTTNPYVAGAAAGVGGAEAERRVLSDAETGAIVQAEIAERHAAAAQYDEAGHADRAARLRREADVLTSVAADR